MIEKISTPDAPAAIGPYAQAVRCGNLLFTSRPDRARSCKRPTRRK